MSNQDSVDKCINAACDQFNVIVKHPKVLEVVSESLFEELLDEIILGICYDAHRNYKRGYLNLYPDECDPNQPESTEAENYNNTDSIKCVCPKCDKRVGALKFAFHLNKCMRKSRNSSRIANMKISSGKDRDNNIYANAISDDENDADWLGEKKRKKKNNRGSSKRKHKMDTDTNDEKSKQICGVITKHTKKKCKSINCTHHIEQRKSQKCENDFPIDIEGGEDLNGDLGRDSIELNSNASSPSSSSHSSSKRRDKSSKGKSKSSKKSSRRSLSS